MYDAAWRARMARVFSGALRVWGAAGTVREVPGDERAFVIAPVAGPELRVSHDAEGWTLRVRDAYLGSHAGLPGLLRRVRERLAPDAPAGRLVIGAQHLLGPASDER